MILDLGPTIRASACKASSPCQSEDQQRREELAHVSRIAMMGELTASLAQRRIIVRTAMTDNHTVRVSVTDFGVGIDENNSERQFEPFYTTKSDGLGMGLSISRTIVKGHGGTMGASNNKDGGATFAFTLPTHQGGPS